MELRGNAITRYIALLFGGLFSGLYIYSAIAVLSNPFAYDGEIALAVTQLVLFTVFLIYVSVGEILYKRKEITFFQTTSPAFGMLILAIFETVSCDYLGFNDLSLSMCIILMISVVGFWVLMSLPCFINSLPNPNAFRLAAKICVSVGCGYYAGMAMLSFIGAINSGVFILIFATIAILLFTITVIVDVWFINGDSFTIKGVAKHIRKTKSIAFGTTKQYANVYDRMMAQERLSLNDVKMAEALYNQAIITIYQLEEIKQKYGNQIIDDQQKQEIS